MTGHGALLSIDLWHDRMAAVVRSPTGRTVPVVVDGAVVTPTGVAVAADGSLRPGRAGAQLGQQDPTAYVRIPGRRLLDDQTSIGETRLDPVDVVAAVLALVAHGVQAHQTLPDEVVIAIPAGWTGRQRHRLRQAAARAGLGQPRLVNAAECIVREHLANGGDLPVGKVAVVCRLGATAGELVLVQRERDRYEVLAVFDLGELGETGGSSIADQAAAALDTAVDATGIGADQIAVMLCDTPASAMPALAAALANLATPSASPTHIGELAAALGATRTHNPLPPARRTRHVAAGVVITGAGFAAAGSLAVQALNAGFVVEATDLNPRFVVVPPYLWGLAPVFAMLGVVGLAVLAADRAAAREPRAGPEPVLATGLLVAAVVGVGGGLMLAVQGGAVYAVSPQPMLRWALASTVPLAVVLAVVGLVAMGLAPPRSRSGVMPWREVVRPPAAAVVVGGLSTVVLVAAITGYPRVDSDLWWRMEHLAGYGLGWAIALHLLTNPWRRAILGFLLSAGCTYANSVDTDDVISACLIATVNLGALVRFGPAVAMLVRAPDRASVEGS
jgi:hypothetical protein